MPRGENASLLAHEVDSILANNLGEFEIVIRPSHEMNGEWFVRGAGGSCEVLIPERGTGCWH